MSIVVAQAKSVAMDKLGAKRALVTGRDGGISRRSALKLALAVFVTTGRFHSDRH
jgi:hypothetical protein